MDKFDDKLKQRFQTAKVADEAWLEPSKDTFTQIEQAIAQPKEDKYKKFLHLIIASLIVSMILMYLILSKGGTNGLSQIESSKENIEIYGGNVLSSNSTKNLIASTESQANIDIVSTSTETSNNSEVKLEGTNTQKDIVSSASNTISRTNITDSAALTTNSTLVREKTTYSSIKKVVTLASEPKERIENAALNFNDLSPILKSNSKSSAQERIAKPDVLVQTPKLTSLNFGLTGTQTKTSASPNFAPVSIVPLERNSAYLDLTISTVFWKDKLNSNYLSALSPADFSQNTERGYDLNLSYHKHIYHPIAIGFQTSYSNIEVNSGHNTLLNYDVSSESNGSQNFNALTLATPYGFVDSDIVVSRAAGNTDETRSLNASIHSKHNIKILNFAPSLDVHLFQKDKFKLVMNLNAGLNYILSLNNQIDFLETGHSDYTLQSGAIIDEQSHVNYTFWNAGIGFRTLYKLSARFSVGARFAYSGGLTPLFKMDDFSGRSSATNLGLNTSYSF